MKNFNLALMAVLSFALSFSHMAAVHASHEDEKKQKRPSTTYQIQQPDGNKMKVKVKSHDQFKVSVKQTYKGQKITLKPYK